jgi:metal-responsive CopG/Arc/MetJ family transcriptional regulator
MSKKKVYKSQTNISVNIDLVEMMDEYLKDIGNDNRSKYIEKLITEDLIKRGKEIKKEF